MGTIELHTRPADPAQALDLTASEIASASGRLVVRTLKRIAVAIYDWQDLARQRHALMALDQHMLNDMGIERGDFEQVYKSLSDRASSRGGGWASWS